MLFFVVVVAFLRDRQTETETQRQRHRERQGQRETERQRETVLFLSWYVSFVVLEAFSKQSNNYKTVRKTGD